MKVDKAEVLQLIKDVGLTIDIDKFGYDASLQKAGVDSLDMANILLSIEEKYGVKLIDSELWRVDSINALVELLNRSKKSHNV